MLSGIFISYQIHNGAKNYVQLQPISYQNQISAQAINVKIKIISISEEIIG